MKVCVGIVTHNRAGILPRALDSVREQSWKDIEVVVIDDGSTDETSALSARYPEVKWIRYEKPRGYRHARNRFMRETDAAYFVSLDDDSWFLKGDEIQIAMAMMADNGRLGAIAFDIRTPDFPAARERGPREPVNTFVGCGHLLRLEAVRAAGYYEDVPGDYGSEEKDLSIQLLDMGYEIVRLPGVDVWHEQTMVMRDLRGQHRSGVCNDLAFALRRCPSPSVAWVIPAKIFNHLVFSLRFGLRGKAGLGEFDRKVVDKIGMLGFVRPSLSGTLLFLKNLPSLLRNRRPVSPYAYRIYVERSRRRRWSQFGGTVASVSVSITTRNRREDLEETLREIQSLEPPPEEIIICADGCTDSTVEFIRENYPDIRLLISEEWQGSIPSRDRIFQTAKNDIVLSLDDDSFPIERDFIPRLLEVFNRNPDVGVITFPQRTDEYPETLEQTDFGEPRYIQSYQDSGGAIRRHVYKALPGYATFFQHAYEEPDFSAQCYGRGLNVLFWPYLTVRHRYTSAQRNEMRTHHFHTRNELWSVVLRSPVLLIVPLLMLRAVRQLTYACRRGPSWAIREPICWVRFLRGLPRCLASRAAVRLSPYWRWLSLGNKSIPMAMPAASPETKRPHES